MIIIFNGKKFVQRNLELNINLSTKQYNQFNDVLSNESDLDESKQIDLLNKHEELFKEVLDDCGNSSCTTLIDSCDKCYNEFIEHKKAKALKKYFEFVTREDMFSPKAKGKIAIIGGSESKNIHSYLGFCSLPSAHSVIDFHKEENDKLHIVDFNDGVSPFGAEPFKITTRGLKIPKSLKSQKIKQSRIERRKSKKTNYCTKCFIQFTNKNKYIKHLNKNH